jgi:hypothetical protein
VVAVHYACQLVQGGQPRHGLGLWTHPQSVQPCLDVLQLQQSAAEMVLQQGLQCMVYVLGVWTHPRSAQPCP